MLPIIACTLGFSTITVEAPKPEIVVQEYNVEAMIAEVAEKQDELATELMQQQRDIIATRGVIEGRKCTMVVTAYTLRYEECGKHPDDPDYGITASGERVKEWYTIAVPKSIPFGTKIYIPYFKDKPNGGIFVAKDRGAAIKEGRLDVYMTDLNEALRFGKQTLEVVILGRE